MRVLVCGVRGSTSAPGADFVRYGGHTSCVAIAHDQGPPVLVLDAGTGLRTLAPLLDGAPFRGTMLLTHLHWDHTHGLPFFPAGDRAEACTRLLIPAQGDPITVLERALSPPHFPITPAQLRGRWSFESLEPGEHTIEGFSVLALEIPHKGGRTYGYRVADATSSIAYLPDHSPTTLGPGEGFGEYHEAALRLAAGVDVLFHDAQYTAEEFPARATFGHSAIDYAVELARRSAAGQLLLFHHEPARTDAELDAIVAMWRHSGVRVSAASEGTELTLTRRSA
ncbi:MAG: MBL fold metallo-hydrolase [Candidatus Dormibacteria bacterium]